MSDFEEREASVFQEADFVPHGDKAIVFRDLTIITNNEMTDYGKVGRHEKVIGIAVRIEGARHGAIPELEIGTEGTLTAKRFTDDVDENGNPMGLIEMIHSAIVYECNPQGGWLVLIAASSDGYTSPHSYSAM